MSDQESDQEPTPRINKRWMAEAESLAKLKAIQEADGTLRRKGSPLQPGQVAVILDFFGGSDQKGEVAPDPAGPTPTPNESAMENNKAYWARVDAKIANEQAQEKGKRPLSMLD